MVKKITTFILFFVIYLSIFSQKYLYAAECDNKIGSEKIRCLEQKLQQLKQEKNTLSSQILFMDTQISLTTLQINQTELKIINTGKEIDLLGSRIEGLDQSLDYLSKLLIQRIIEGYKKKPFTIFSLLFDNKNANDFLNQVKYLKTVQDNNQKLLYTVQETKTNAEEQKKLREEKKIELDKLNETLNYQKQSLDNQKVQKQTLLADTQNDEKTYQSLLSQAKAQLAGFASFAQSQGGGSLSNQTSCDGWGCYYNQRDSQWGSFLINGSNDCNGPCNIERVGCLVTSLSMIISHLGNNGILPSDIASSNPSNFSVGTASLKKGTISVKGVNITRTTISGSLSPDLLQNGPLIVGVYSGPFGTHFMVIKSYTDGKYIMNDPYTEGGKDKNFTDYYSLGSVFEVDRVSM